MIEIRLVEGGNLEPSHGGSDHHLMKKRKKEMKRNLLIFFVVLFSWLEATCFFWGRVLCLPGLIGGRGQLNQQPYGIRVWW